MSRGRRFTVEEKRAIIVEYEDAPYGSKTLVLRRHRLSWSTLQRFFAYRDAGLLDSGARKGWPYLMTPRAESAEISRLRGEVRRLEAALAREQRNRHVAEAAAEALGKASALLQAMLESAEPSSSEPSSPVASWPSSPPG